MPRLAATSFALFAGLAVSLSILLMAGELDRTTLALVREVFQQPERFVHHITHGPAGVRVVWALAAAAGILTCWGVLAAARRRRPARPEPPPAPQPPLPPSGGPAVPDPQAPPPPPQGVPAGNVLAAIASFFLPGLGQLAQARPGAALGVFLLSMGLWFCTGGLLGWLGHVVACLDAAAYRPPPDA